MRIKSILLALLAVIMGVCVAKAEDDFSSISEIAIFKTDGVNLRQEPSAQSAYLIYTLSDDELYFDEANIMWSNEIGGLHINGQYVQPSHQKMQGEKGMSLAVLGKEGDWVKLRYYGHDVWTMSKFLNIKPVVTPETTTVVIGDLGYNRFSLTGSADGSLAIMYQEAGMDEDEGLMIGEKKGNIIVFDRFLPMTFQYDENVSQVSISKDPEFGTLTFTYGPQGKLASFADYPVINVKEFSADNIRQMLTLATKLEAPQVFVTTGTEYVMLPQ